MIELGCPVNYSVDRAASLHDSSACLLLQTHKYHTSHSSLPHTEGCIAVHLHKAITGRRCDQLEGFHPNADRPRGTVACTLPCLSSHTYYLPTYLPTLPTLPYLT